MNGLPIDMEILQKRQSIPVKLAEVSYFDQNAAIRLLRDWGEKRKPITVLFDELIELTNGKKGGE